jgi:hypothetical protein
MSGGLWWVRVYRYDSGQVDTCRSLVRSDRQKKPTIKPRGGLIRMSLSE